MAGRSAIGPGQLILNLGTSRLTTAYSWLGRSWLPTPCKSLIRLWLEQMMKFGLSGSYQIDCLRTSRHRPRLLQFFPNSKMISCLPAAWTRSGNHRKPTLWYRSSYDVASVVDQICTRWISQYFSTRWRRSCFSWWMHQCSSLSGQVYQGSSQSLCYYHVCHQAQATLPFNRQMKFLPWKDQTQSLACTCDLGS